MHNRAQVSNQSTTPSGMHRGSEDETDTRDRSVNRADSFKEENAPGRRRPKLLDAPKPWSTRRLQQQQPQFETLSSSSDHVLYAPQQSKSQTQQTMLMLPTGEPSEHPSESENFDHSELPEDLVNFNDIWNASSKSSLLQQESKSSLLQPEDNNDSKKSFGSEGSCASSPSNEDEDIFANGGGSFRKDDDSESALHSSAQIIQPVLEESGQNIMRDSLPEDDLLRINSREEEKKCPSPPVLDNKQEYALPGNTRETQPAQDSAIRADEAFPARPVSPKAEPRETSPTDTKNKLPGKPQNMHGESTNSDENANASAHNPQRTIASRVGMETMEPTERPLSQSSPLQSQYMPRQPPQQQQPPPVQLPQRSSLQKYNVHSKQMDSAIMLNSLRKQLSVLKALDQQRINAVSALNSQHSKEVLILRLQQQEQRTSFRDLLINAGNHKRHASSQAAGKTDASSEPQKLQPQQMPSTRSSNPKISAEAFDDEDDVKSLTIKKRHLEEINVLKKEHAEQLDALRKRHLYDVRVLQEQLDEFRTQQREDTRSDDGDYESIKSESVKSERLEEIAFLHDQLDEMRRKYAVAANNGNKISKESLTGIEDPGYTDLRKSHEKELALLEAQDEILRESEKNAVSRKERLESEVTHQLEELETLKLQLRESRDKLIMIQGDRKEEMLLERNHTDEVQGIKTELERARASNVDVLSSNEALRKAVQQKETEVSRMQQELDEKKAAGAQLENKLEIAKEDLRVKSERQRGLEDDIEEVRQQLTKSNMRIEHLVEERSYSQAKLSEYAAMMEKKGGPSEAQNERLVRASEIAQLNTKMNNLNQKLLERDDKIFKLEEDMEATNALVLQLSAMFVEGDTVLETQQKLLIDSAAGASQANALLLMRMMNMLENMKSESEKLHRERDESVSKATKYKGQLKEGRSKFNLLKSELQQLQQDSARANGTTDRVPPQSPRTNSHGSPPPPAAFPASSTVVSPEAAQDQEHVSSTPPKSSRLMNFIKNNLNQEQVG